MRNIELSNLFKSNNLFFAKTWTLLQIQLQQQNNLKLLLIFSFHLSITLAFLFLFLCTLFYFLYCTNCQMSDPFSLEPTSGKSWADIVEEEEEYNRLHPDSELEEEDLLLNEEQPSLPVTIATDSTVTEENKEKPVIIKEKEEVKDTKKEEGSKREEAKEEPAKPILTGAKASRWATAPSDSTPAPPKRWERPSSNFDHRKEQDTPIQKSGAMASKWAKAPPTTTSRYDSSNYNNRRSDHDSRSSTYRTDDESKLIRTNFESKSTEGYRSSRNHYNKEFDRFDRNGGFNNKDNFKYLAQRRVDKEEVQEASNKEKEEEEAIQNWNSYKPAKDEGQEKQQEEKLSPALDLKPLPPSFSWADDIPTSDDEEKVKEEPVAISAKDEKKEVEKSLSAPTYTWGSLEEKKVEEPTVSIKEEIKVEKPVIKQDIKKPLPSVTYKWGSLEEEKPKTHSIEQHREIRLLPQTPPTKVDLVALSSDNKEQEESWNPNVSWNAKPAPSTSGWSAMDDTTAAAIITQEEEKPIIKDTWKSKIPATKEDNAPKWKAFAESVAIPAPAPVSQPSTVQSTKEEGKKESTISLSDLNQDLPKVQQSNTSTLNSNPQEISFSLNDLTSENNTKKVLPSLLSLSFNELSTGPQQITLSFNDLIGSPTQEKAPKMSLCHTDQPTTHLPKEKTVLLKMSDFDQPPPPSPPSASLAKEDRGKGWIQEDESMKRERHPESWGSVNKTPIHHGTNNEIVESSGPPRRKLHLAGAQWNNLQKNLLNK